MRNYHNSSWYTHELQTKSAVFQNPSRKILIDVNQVGSMSTDQNSEIVRLLRFVLLDTPLLLIVIHKLLSDVLTSTIPSIQRDSIHQLLNRWPLIPPVKRLCMYSTGGRLPHKGPRQPAVYGSLHLFNLCAHPDHSLCQPMDGHIL